jgi:hypothetical protein
MEALVWSQGEGESSRVTRYASNAFAKAIRKLYIPVFATWGRILVEMIGCEYCDRQHVMDS